MEKTFKFLLPSPNFDKNANKTVKARPHFLTPSGMTLLPREKQPPPMYGSRGATVPAKFLQPVDQIHLSSPEPVKQYCEPCELELACLEDFKRHRAQHEQCPVDGCQYRGHPSVMDKHITVLHNSGLFEKFKKLSTPEEIAEWREERRKRYPTVANVILKQKAQEQRQKRGERLEKNTNRFGREDDRKRALPRNEFKGPNSKTENNVEGKNMTQSRNKNKKRKRQNRDKKEDKVQQETNIQKSNEKKEDKVHIYRMFCGTLGMKDYTHVNTKNKTATNNVLFGLVGMYGSDNSEDSEDSTMLDDSSCDAKNLCDISYDESLVEGNKTKTENIAKEGKCADVENTAKEQQTENRNSIVIEQPKEAEEITEHTNEVQALDHATNTDELSTVTKEEPLASSISPAANKQEALQGTTDPSCTNNSSLVTTVEMNSSDEGPEELAIERSIPEYKINPETLPSTSSNTGLPANPEQTRNQDKKLAKDTKSSHTVKRKSGLDYRKLKVRKQNTMLEKLLESDIRHERNVLLQCVRYVCENKFFGVGHKS